MKKRVAILFSFLVLFLLSTSSARAELNNASTSGRYYPRVTVAEERKELRATVVQERQDFRANVKEERQEFRASVSAEILAKREEFKLKLKTIKDTRKQLTLERVASRSAEINKKRTDQMMNVLDRLTELLSRLEEKINQGNLGNQGNLSSLIVLARTAIQNAKDAVGVQSQKEYVISITTESALRQTVGQMMSQLEQDLRATREKVIAARKATMDVFAEFMKLKGEKEASGSGEIQR
jgi:hypothetical protein